MVGIRFHRVGFSIDVWAGKKIITTVDSYSTRETTKRARKVFEQFLGGFCYAHVRGTRVGRYNNNNRTRDRYTRYTSKLFRTVRLTTMVVAVNFLT